MKQNNNEERIEEQDIWQQKCKTLSEKIETLEHEHKKMTIELKTELEFERKRADEFEEKFKNAIRYKNEEEELKTILNELSEKLKNKENQILEFMKSDQEKKRKIGELGETNEELLRSNEELKEQLSQIQQGAISALLQKDSIISDLEQKVIQFENVDVNGIQGAMIELEDKYRDLQDRSEAERREFEDLLKSKQEEMQEIVEKFQVQRQRYEQKISILEEEINSYEKHIEKINEQRHDEQNLEEKCYFLQEKQRKTEKKLHDTEILYKTQKQELLDSFQKLESEIASLKDQSQELKNLHSKIKELQKEIKNKKKENEEQKSAIEKIKTDYLKKITQLEQQKKKTQQSLDIRSQELQRIRNEIDENKAVNISQGKNIEKTPEKDRSLAIDLENMPNLKSGKKESNIEDAALIEKLKAQNADLQQNIDSLNQQLEETTKQAQTLRERLVSTSGSAGRSEGEAELLVQIEDLNSYIKKVENNLMITKLKYAEDESHWSSRESTMKKQSNEIERKYKKEKIQLLERIDRMKKTTGGNSKKVDYYQSSLK